MLNNSGESGQPCFVPDLSGWKADSLPLDHQGSPYTFLNDHHDEFSCHLSPYKDIM